MLSSAPAILDLRSLSTAQPILGSRACTNAGHHKQRSRPDFCELTGQFPTHVSGSSGTRQPWNSQLISPIRCVLTLWSRQFLSQGEGANTFNMVVPALPVTQKIFCFPPSIVNRRQAKSNDLVKTNSASWQSQFLQMPKRTTESRTLS